MVKANPRSALSAKRGLRGLSGDASASQPATEEKHSGENKNPHHACHQISAHHSIHGVSHTVTPTSENVHHGSTLSLK
jgi:ribosomal protein L32